MEQILENLMIMIARSHSYFLSLNDEYAQNFTDKQLHFLFIGLVGMAMVMIVYPLFKLLSKNHLIVIVFIYVFSLIIVLTFAIEIGQWYSGSGTMDLDDVTSGLMGFIIMFLIFAAIRLVILGIWKGINAIRKTGKE